MIQRHVEGRGRDGETDVHGCVKNAIVEMGDEDDYIRKKSNV